MSKKVHTNGDCFPECSKHQHLPLTILYQEIDTLIDTYYGRILDRLPATFKDQGVVLQQNRGYLFELYEGIKKSLSLPCDGRLETFGDLRSVRKKIKDVIESIGNGELKRQTVRGYAREAFAETSRSYMTQIASSLPASQPARKNGVIEHASVSPPKNNNGMSKTLEGIQPLKCPARAWVCDFDEVQTRRMLFCLADPRVTREELDILLKEMETKHKENEVSRGLLITIMLNDRERARSELHDRLMHGATGDGQTDIRPRTAKPAETETDTPPAAPDPLDVPVTTLPLARVIRYLAYVEETCNANDGERIRLLGTLRIPEREYRLWMADRASYEKAAKILEHLETHENRLTYVHIDSFEMELIIRELRKDYPDETALRSYLRSVNLIARYHQHQAKARRRAATPIGEPTSPPAAVAVETAASDSPDDAIATAPARPIVPPFSTHPMTEIDTQEARPIDGAATAESSPAIRETREDTRIGAVISDTAHAAEIVASRTNLPASVRAQVEPLFEAVQYAQAEAERRGENWRKTEEDKERLVKIAAGLMEYANVIPELPARTGNKINAGSVRRYLKQHPSLTMIEGQVLDLLEKELEDQYAEMRANASGKREFDDSVRRMTVAFTRLERKRALHTSAVNDFLESHQISQTVIIGKAWKKATHNDAGEPLLTRDLIPEIFERAEKELGIIKDGDGTAEEPPATETGQATPDIEKTITFWQERPEILVPEEPESSAAPSPTEAEAEPETDEDKGDKYFSGAVQVVREAGKASATLLQRRLGVGYPRAAKLLDRMERKGIVGPVRGAKPREILGAFPTATESEEAATMEAGPMIVMQRTIDELTQTIAALVRRVAALEHGKQSLQSKEQFVPDELTVVGGELHVPQGTIGAIKSGELAMDMQIKKKSSGTTTTKVQLRQGHGREVS